MSSLIIQKRMSNKSFLGAIITSDIVFFYLLGYLLNIHSLFNVSFLVALSVNLIIFIIPGLAWISCFKKNFKNFVLFLIYIIFISTVILLSGSLFHLILKVNFSALSFLIYLFVVSQIGFFLSLRKKLRIDNLKKCWFPIFLAFIIFSFLFFSSLDTDEFEERFWYCTAPGLVNKLQPVMSGTYYFSHPLLSHFYSGYSILLHNKLDNVIASNDCLDKPDPIPITEVNRPLVMATRAPHFFLSSLTCLVLFLLLLSLTRSTFLAFLGTIFYQGYYEIWMRSTFMSYMVPSNFFLLSTIFVFIDQSQSSSLNNHKEGLNLFLPSFLLALTNHKAIILPLAVIVKKIIERTAIQKIIKNPIVIGFGLGTLIWWIYGLSISAKDFITDHFLYHTFNRVIHIIDIEMGSGYTSLIGLWKEFILGFSVPLFIISVVYLFYLLSNREKNILFYWFLIGSFAFSIVDWKQTKHFMLFVPALIIALFWLVSKQKKFIRIILVVLILLFLICNILADLGLYRPFLPQWLYRPNFFPSAGFI